MLGDELKKISSQAANRTEEQKYLDSFELIVKRNNLIENVKKEIVASARHQASQGKKFAEKRISLHTPIDGNESYAYEYIQSFQFRKEKARRKAFDAVVRNPLEQFCAENGINLEGLYIKEDYENRYYSCGFYVSW